MLYKIKEFCCFIKLNFIAFLYLPLSFYGKRQNSVLKNLNPTNKNYQTDKTNYVKPILYDE